MFTNAVRFGCLHHRDCKETCRRPASSRGGGGDGFGTRPRSVFTAAARFPSQRIARVARGGAAIARPAVDLGSDQILLALPSIPSLFHVLLPLFFAPVAAQFEFRQGVVVRRHAGPLFADLQGPIAKEPISSRPLGDVARPVRPLREPPLGVSGVLLLLSSDVVPKGHRPLSKGFRWRADVAVLLQVGPGERRHRLGPRKGSGRAVDDLILDDGRHQMQIAFGVLLLLGKELLLEELLLEPDGLLQVFRVRVHGPRREHRYVIAVILGYCVAAAATSSAAGAI